MENVWVHASEPGCKEMKKCFSKLWIVAQINLFDLGKGTETIFKFCRFPRDIWQCDKCLEGYGNCRRNWF